MIHTDLISKGIRFNNLYRGVIGQILITKPPGSQIVSTLINPPRVSAGELAGSTRTIARFSITDDSNNPINTNGEYWTARICIRWYQ